MASSLTMKKTRYDAIDGLRAFSAIGIVLMHMRANGHYALSGFVYDRIITSFTDLVFLFMTVSAFGMCCGYYEGITQGKIDVDKFYKKRFIKILPYFALLCFLDLAVSPSVDSLYEIFANLTLCFGFLPNCGNISVIGVGWFLGIVFAFYMIFPFFCFMIKSKARAWLSFAVALIFNVVCADHFGIGRKNILYCMVFFVAGGLIYLYKDELSKLSGKFKPIVFVLCIAAAVMYYIVGENVPIMVILFALMLIYAIAEPKPGRENKATVLNNPITKFLSGISLEIYLCHMVIFRGFEKLKMTHFFKSELMSYIFICIGTIIGAIVFAKAVQMCINKIIAFTDKKFASKRNIEETK